jgi:hypothetical protein
MADSPCIQPVAITSPKHTYFTISGKQSNNRFTYMRFRNYASFKKVLRHKQRRRGRWLSGPAIRESTRAVVSIGSSGLLRQYRTAAPESAIHSAPSTFVRRFSGRFDPPCESAEIPVRESSACFAYFPNRSSHILMRRRAEWFRRKLNFRLSDGSRRHGIFRSHRPRRRLLNGYPVRRKESEKSFVFLVIVRRRTLNAANSHFRDQDPCSDSVSGKARETCRVGRSSGCVL